MAVIEARKRKDGRNSYRVRISLKGHPRVSETFLRKTDAKIWAQQTEAAIRQGRYFPTAEAQRRTFGETVDRFLQEKLRLRASRDQGRLENQLRWWLDHFGAETPLARVTPARIVEGRDRLAKGDAPSGRPASPATVKRYLSILSKLLSVAIKEWFWLEENPCRRVPRPREPRGRVRCLTDQERERLLEACRASAEPRLYPLVLLALSTGARRGELLGVRWPDIDLGRGVVLLHHTKNDERRAIPLAGRALAMLQEASKVRRLDTDLVFANPGGLATFPKKPWARALEEAGIGDFTFHDLRHCAASYLAMSGATLAEIAEVLGHRTHAMVKRYSHLTEQHTRGVVERMNSRIFGVADDAQA